MNYADIPDARKKRNDELFCMEPISRQLPYRFHKGSKMTSFIGKCYQCDKEINPDLFRGEIAPLGPEVVRVEALGICPDCKMATIYEYRVYDDLRIVGMRDGKWQTWEAKKENPVPWIVRFLWAAWLLIRYGGSRK